MGLRDIRRAKVLSQRSLAELAGVTQKTIVDIELGHREAKADTVRKLARALQMDPEALYARMNEVQ